MTRKYYGWNEDKNSTIFATVTGQMDDGTLVYTECDGKGNLIDMDKQYTRQLRNHWQEFIRI